MDEAIEKIVDLVHKLAAPAAEEIGKTLALTIVPYRTQLGLRMLHQTQRMIQGAGINPNRVPLRLFLPILDHASVEDDEDMQSRWAALLANAATSPNSVHPSYIEVLRQLAPEDARLLDRFYGWYESRQSRVVLAQNDPFTVAEWQHWRTIGESQDEYFSNLLRLGIVETDYGYYDGGVQVLNDGSGTPRFKSPGLKTTWQLSEFAIRFVQACRAPKGREIIEGGINVESNSRTSE